VRVAFWKSDFRKVGVIADSSHYKASGSNVVYWLCVTSLRLVCDFAMYSSSAIPPLCSDFVKKWMFTTNLRKVRDSP
jgi:hypothetical protein